MSWHITSSVGNNDTPLPETKPQVMCHITTSVLSYAWLKLPSVTQSFPILYNKFVGFANANSDFRRWIHKDIHIYVYNIFLDLDIPTYVDHFDIQMMSLVRATNACILDLFFVCTAHMLRNLEHNFHCCHT